MTNIVIFVISAILLCVLVLLGISKHNKIVFVTSVLTIALFGVVCALMSHYGQCGFNLRWFLCLELPLYIFLGWAIAKGIVPYLTKMFNEENKHNNN